MTLPRFLPDPIPASPWALVLAAARERLALPDRRERELVRALESCPDPWERERWGVD